MVEVLHQLVFTMDSISWLTVDHFPEHQGTILRLHCLTESVDVDLVVVILTEVSSPKVNCFSATQMVSDTEDLRVIN